MKDDEAESKKKIEAAFATSGLKVPALARRACGAEDRQVSRPEDRDPASAGKNSVQNFRRTGLSSQRPRRVAPLIAAQKTKSPRMDVATFKELTGVSRKYAIPLLEYLDREHITRRVGDAREILVRGLTY